MNTIEILTQAHHRNGVMGQPFNVTLFRDDACPAELNPFVAIGLGSEAQAELGQVPCFVLSVPLLAQGVIAFGENSWRGDQIAERLRIARAAIAKAQEAE